MDGYNRLYEAIFVQALEDDVREIKAGVFNELTNRLQDKYKVKDFISTHNDFIKSKVQPYILQESQDYPMNNRIVACKNRKRVINLLVAKFIEEQEGQAK